MSSAVPGVDCNCHWMKRAPQKWRAVVVCLGCEGAFLCFCSISQYRQDEIGWLVLFTSFRFVLGEFCCPERTAFVLCNQGAHSSKWHITYRAPTVVYFLPSSHFLPCSISCPWSIAQRWRCVLLPDLNMPLLRARIYGSHLLSSQSWRNKRCKCQSVSP